MKKVLLVVGLVLMIASNVNSNDLDGWLEELKLKGINDGDPNQNVIIDATENYIVIYNPSAKTNIGAMFYDKYKTMSANVFRQEAIKHCKKNNQKNSFETNERIHFDEHTAYFYCNYNFEEEIKRYYKLGSSKKESDEVSVTSLCIKFSDDELLQKDCRKKKYQKMINKYPYAKTIYEKIKNHQRKFTDSTFLFDLKKKALARGNQPSISTEDQNTVVAASSGTGFFVSTNGHMVTNNHVIDSCDTVKVHYKGRELDANVLFADRTNDLAIIKANIKPEKVFPVSNEDVSLLEDIIVAGYPLGKELSASIKTFKGSVTALAGLGDNFSNFQIDASLSSGNSGGPIINQKGNVVGVAVEKWIEVGVEGFNFGVKSSTLKTFASSNQIKFQDPSNEELSNKELGQLITEATIYLECWMSVAKIKQIIQEGERQKAFFSEYK